MLRRDRRQVLRELRGLRRTVGMGLLGFVGLVALQHPLRADLPPGEHFISEYAKGSTAGVQIVAFACWAIALAAGAALVETAPSAAGRPVARRVAAGGLGLAAAGIAGAAIFATQTVAGALPPGVQRTTTGRLHDIGTLLALLGLVAAAAASPRVAPRRGYRIALATLTAVLVLSVPVLVVLGIDAPGIGQRVFVLVGCALQWLLATELSPLSDRPARRA